jgi:large subunit ribosomal protein L9
MKVILKTDVSPLGKSGELVEVKPGYGRNYLIPHNLAVEATRKNVNQLDHEKRLIALQQHHQLADAEKLLQRLESYSCTIPCKVGEEDRLFGSVTARDIAETLHKDGYPVDKRDVQLEEPLKNLGVYTVPVRVGPKIEAKLKVWLVKK